MDCKAVKNRASLWLDGKLAFGGDAFLQHLDSCRSCARETAELQRVLAALHQTAPAFPAPEGFAPRVMGRIREEPARHSGSLLVKKLAMAASFLFLLGMNSLLVSRYLGGGKVIMPPVTAPASDRAGYPVLPVPPPEIFTQPEPVTTVPKSAPAGNDTVENKRPSGPQKAPVAPAKPVATAAVLPPPPAKPEKQQEPERQVMVASALPATIPGPEIFVQQRRVTEGVLLKVAVTELAQASQRLSEAAGIQGLAPVMASEMLADDGRMIKVYRYELPYLLADRFVAEALTLGRVLDERHVTEDVSDLYGQKLEQYRQLAAKALEARGAEAEELHRTINSLIMELVGMHNTSQDMKAVTVWLEG